MTEKEGVLTKLSRRRICWNQREVRVDIEFGVRYRRPGRGSPDFGDAQEGSPLAAILDAIAGGGAQRRRGTTEWFELRFLRDGKPASCVFGCKSAEERTSWVDSLQSLRRLHELGASEQGLSQPPPDDAPFGSHDPAKNLGERTPFDQAESNRCPTPAERSTPGRGPALEEAGGNPAEEELHGGCPTSPEIEGVEVPGEVTAGACSFGEESVEPGRENGAAEGDLAGPTSASS